MVSLGDINHENSATESSNRKIYDYDNEGGRHDIESRERFSSRSPSREKTSPQNEQTDSILQNEEVEEQRRRSRSPDNNTGEPIEGCSLLVRNLRFETSPSRVRRHFERYGTVRDVYLPLDYYTRRPRGFGFVEYMDPRDAEDAVNNLDGSVLDGSTIRVVVAHDRRKSPETMRKIQKDTARFSRSSGYSSRFDRPGGHPPAIDYRNRYRSEPYRHSSYREDDRYSRSKRRYPSKSASRSPYRGRSGSRDRSCSNNRDTYQGKRYRH
ncbi:RNA recognition motif family protein [Cryptosporidium serpentis]